MLFVIMKNGKYVKDFTDGEELTKGKNKAEYFYSKKSAIIKAQEYGKKYGTGFHVVETY